MRGKLFVVAATAGALTVSGCGFTGLYGASLPGGADLGDHPFTITAYFDDALDLVPQSAVKVNDVAVGKVTKISLGKEGAAECGQTWCAKVELAVNDSVTLPDNATAEIAQTSLLGEKYVSLNQPTQAPSDKKLGDGATIRLDHTRSAAEVEQVLGALSLLLNEGGLRQIKIIGAELVTALKGREPQVKDLLDRLNTFVGTLDDNKDKITTALTSIDKLAVTLNRQKQILLDALDTYPAALKVLSQERTKLVKLLTSLDKLGVVATDVITKTQQGLVSSLKDLNPVLTQLRASGSDFPGALRVMATFPFPLGASRSFVRGDYANLDAYLDLDLLGTLCQLKGLGALCKDSHVTPSSAKQQSAGGNAAREHRLQPMIVGAGR